MGGLVIPGTHIDLIIKTANKLLESVRMEKNIFVEKDIMDKIYVNVIRILDIKTTKFPFISR